MSSFVNNLIQVERLERKLHKAAATGHLTSVLNVLHVNGEYFVKNWRQKRRRNMKKRQRRCLSDSSDSSDSLDLNHAVQMHRGSRQSGPETDSELDESSSSDQSSSSSESEVDLTTKKRHRCSYSSRTSRQSDAMRAALSNIDINCMDVKGLTPLHHACCMGLPEVVAFFISEGADVAAQDREGNSPLHIAAHYGFTDIIAMLKEAGGDMHAVNHEGITPLIAVEARLERLRKEKEKSLNSNSEWTYVQPRTSGASRSSDDESTDDESRWGEPQPQKNWSREAWSEFPNDDNDDDDDDAVEGSNEKSRPEAHLDEGLFEELTKKWKREQEEQNREAKRILEEEIDKDRAWIERVLQKKGVDRYSRYEISWKKFFESDNQLLGYTDVPFPVEKGKEADLSKVVLHNAPPSEHKQLLRKEILRWHPDKFVQKFRSRLRDSDLEQVLERVNELSQALNELYSSV